MNQEKKIKNAYDVLDLTVEGANIGTWSWNLLDNTVIYSSKWAELRGLSTSDLKMSIEDWSSRVHPDDLNFAYERINDYKLGKSKYFEALHRVKHRSGKWIYILGRGKFTDYDENNKPVRFVGIDVDISELTESKKKLETIFKFSPVTLFECLNNNKWTMTYLSPQIYDLSGYKANDLLLDFNISFLEIIYDEDRDIVRNTIEQIFKDNSYYEIEYRIRHISGELKWVWERGSLSKDKNTVNGVIVDITDKKRIEKDLEDQRQIVFHQSKLASIGQLAAGVGHEINNPLTIVKGQLDMITHQNQNNKDLTNRLNKVSLAIDRIVNIVRGLKNLARTDHEVFEQFSLTDMLSETINMINEIYKAENISLSTDIEKNINIVGNLGRLQQVVMNLLINAKDALSVSKNKQVFLTMKSHLHHVEIIVRDTGSGISPNIIDKIFDPFFTTKEVNKGTGMGLALVNKIIEEHQGSIKTHSIENVGTTFNVNIPLLKENETKSNLNEHTASETAVIVDDEEEIIEILKDLLKDLGIDAKGFTKAQDAIKWIEKNNSVGHIFSDLKMPQMSGVDFVKTIKSKNKYLGKVYFISGGTTVGIEDLKNISDGFIEKPFNKNKIKDLLGK